MLPPLPGSRFFLLPEGRVHGGNGARRNKALLFLLFAQRAYCTVGRKEAIHQDIHDDDNYPGWNDFLFCRCLRTYRTWKSLCIPQSQYRGNKSEKMRKSWRLESFKIGGNMLRGWVSRKDSFSKKGVQKVSEDLQYCFFVLFFANCVVKILLKRVKNTCFKHLWELAAPSLFF